MKRRFDWLGVIILSIITQFVFLHFLVFIEVKLLPTTSADLLIKVNFFLIALIGGLVATHFYIRYSPNMGGICAALFVLLGELYSEHAAFNYIGLFLLLVAYLAGYVGSTLYTNKPVIKRFR